jgi:hypothetical protein
MLFFNILKIILPPKINKKFVIFSPKKNLEINISKKGGNNLSYGTKSEKIQPWLNTYIAIRIGKYMGV